jgi:hypothetical protein
MVYPCYFPALHLNITACTSVSGFLMLMAEQQMDLSGVL